MRDDFAEVLATTKWKPSAFSELVFGTPLHGGQRRYTRNARADVNFLLPGNSWGKTEFICRFMTWLAWWKHSGAPPADMEAWLAQQWKGLIASYTYPVAKESFERFKNHHRNREELRFITQKVIESDPVYVELTNGSRIDWGSLDGEGRLVEAARRQAVAVDEAGHIPDLSSTFDNILFPRTLGVGGRIHLLGTPKAHSDPYLLEVFEKGRDGRDPFYYSQEGSVFENEYWPESEKVRLLKNPRYVKGWAPCVDETTCDFGLCWKGEPAPDDAGRWHPVLTPIGGQVALGRFVIAGGYFFNRPHVARMFTGDWDHVWHDDTHMEAVEEGKGPVGQKVKVPALPNRLYLGAFDLGGNKARKRGTKGSDPTVGFVIDYTERPWRIVYYRYIEGGAMDWDQKYQVMSDVFTTYPMPYLLIDSTGTVDSVTEALQSRGVEVEGVQLGGNGGKKFDMLRNLQLCTELEWSGSMGVLRSPLIPKLKHELDHYVLPDDHIVQDHVMALAMLCHHIAQWEMPDAISGDVY